MAESVLLSLQWIQLAIDSSRTHCMSQLFFVPVLRHFWHWLGVRPAHRKVMEKILSSGTSVVLCPGGVQVCTQTQPLCMVQALGMAGMYVQGRSSLAQDLRLWRRSVL